MPSMLGQRLRAARAALHPEVTQREVARRLKLSPSAVNLWEKGKTEPGADDLVALSRWFQVSTDWLLGVDETKPGKRQPGPPLFSVPVVPSVALIRWAWEAVSELLQTQVAYPTATAAAVLVSSDALTSACPTGAYAVISKSHPVQSGSIVMAQVSRASDPVLRRYIKEGGSDLLVADDMRFPTFKLSDGVKLIGRVTEVVIRKTLI